MISSSKCLTLSLSSLCLPKKIWYTNWINQLKPKNEIEETETIENVVNNYLNQGKILSSVKEFIFSIDVGYNFTKTWTPWSVFFKVFTKILTSCFSRINLYGSFSNVLLFRYKNMLFDAILTLKKQKPLGTRLIYPPPTSVSTATFSDDFFANIFSFN